MADRGISVRLPEEMIERLDAVAKKCQISRHQLLKNLITDGIGDGEVLARVGFIDVAVALRNLSEKFQNRDLDSTENICSKFGHQ